VRTKNGSLVSVVKPLGKDGKPLGPSDIAFGSLFQGSKIRIIDTSRQDRGGDSGEGLLGSSTAVFPKHRGYIDFTRERVSFDPDAEDTKKMALRREQEFAGVVRLASAIERLQKSQFPSKKSYNLPIRQSAERDWDEAPLPSDKSDSITMVCAVQIMENEPTRSGKDTKPLTPMYMSSFKIDPSTQRLAYRMRTNASGKKVKVYQEQEDYLDEAGKLALVSRSDARIEIIGHGSVRVATPNLYSMGVCSPVYLQHLGVSAKHEGDTAAEEEAPEDMSDGMMEQILRKQLRAGGGGGGGGGGGKAVSGGEGRRRDPPHAEAKSEAEDEDEEDFGFGAKPAAAEAGDGSPEDTLASSSSSSSAFPAAGAGAASRPALSLERSDTAPTVPTEDVSDDDSDEDEDEEDSSEDESEEEEAEDDDDDDSDEESDEETEEERREREELENVLAAKAQKKQATVKSKGKKKKAASDPAPPPAAAAGTKRRRADGSGEAKAVKKKRKKTKVA